MNHKSHDDQRSTSTEKFCNEMLDTLNMISQICNEELLPTLARMRQTRDESSTVCTAKEYDMLGDTYPDIISSTHDDGSMDVHFLT